jgi:hypothetical protein
MAELVLWIDTATITWRVPKKTEDFGGELNFPCYSLPLSKGISNLPMERMSGSG